MFKDISLYIDNNKVDFEYEIDKDKIIIKTIDELEIGKKLKIFYDENIYEIKLNNSTKFSKGKAGEIFINLDIKKLSFSVILKNNFFVKSVYKYINKLINKDILINEIKIFLNSKVGKKYKKDLNILLDNIENKDKSLEELIINNENEYERIWSGTWDLQWMRQQSDAGCIFWGSSAGWSGAVYPEPSQRQRTEDRAGRPGGWNHCLSCGDFRDRAEIYLHGDLRAKRKGLAALIFWGSGGLLRIPQVLWMKCNWLEKIHDTHGTDFLEYDILFKGICPKCQKKIKDGQIY